MGETNTPQRTWILVAAFSGIAGILSYFGAAFLPLPDLFTRLLAFAFGPLLIVSFMGLYRFMSAAKDGPVLQIAIVFGIIAGVLVTSMLVVQVGNNMVRSELLSEANSEEFKESVQITWRAVNRVQYLLDVVWDIFICGALILLGTVMLGHPAYGKVWGGLGILLSLGLLVLNLQTFPEAPAYAGSVDLGPFVALWMLAMFIRTSFIRD